MSEPIFDPATEHIYNRLPAHFRRVDPANDYALKKYLAGPGELINRVEKLVDRLDYDDTKPGDTSDLTDPRTADLEWLPWLAQLLGVNLSSNVVDEGTRNEIVNASSGYKAGTDSAIIAAVQSELVGTKSVRLKKRYTDTVPGGPWDLQIQTLQSETLFNILPPAIAIPTSARNLELYSNPAGFTGRTKLTIGTDPDFYKSRAIQFTAVPETSGVGSEAGDIDDGYGEDDFGLEAFGTGDNETTGPTEYYFYTPFYFPLDGSDPLSSFVDIKYVSGSNPNITVSANILTYKLQGTDIYVDQNHSVGTSNEVINVGDTHHIIGRSEALPIAVTHGRWLIRLQNIGADAVIRIGHFGARKEAVYQWVPRTANPVQAVIDRGAKPAGIKLWHTFGSSSWAALENGGATTWNDLEAIPTWVDVEEFDGPNL